MNKNMEGNEVDYLDQLEFPIEEVKVRINNLLWQVLPKDTSIGEAEKLACQWVELYEKLGEKE